MRIFLPAGSQRSKSLSDNLPPFILSDGAIFERKTYILVKDEVKMEVDEEFGKMFLQEIIRLGRMIAEAENEEMKAEYQAQLDALYKEFGSLLVSTTRTTRTPIPKE